jgi:hypothetical protein
MPTIKAVIIQQIVIIQIIIVEILFDNLLLKEIVIISSAFIDELVPTISISPSIYLYYMLHFQD